MRYFQILLAIAGLSLICSCAEISSFEEPDSGDIIEPGDIPTVDGEVVTEGAVDLGLSVKWAACNLGASACFELGTSFQWGDQRKDCLLDICGTQYDQATAVLGTDWRLPTKDQAQELINKCRWNNTTYRGESGFIVTGPSKKAIFIKMGNYWTGTANVNTNFAYFIEFNHNYNYNKYEYVYEPELSEVSRTSYNYIRPVYVGSN